MDPLASIFSEHAAAADEALFGDTAWSPSQQRALRAVLQREKCVLITGAGGTGKSMLINHIVRTLRGRGAKVAVMAHTGVAAVTVGGQTTWSFMQFSPELLAGTKEAAAATLKKRKYLVDQFKAVRAIVIDEVSMMDPIEIEFMDHILQVCRGIYRPFGGVQIVLVGDFYQLPPVEDRARKPLGSRRFIFQSDAFWRGIAEMHELSEAFRQTDEVFIGVLHRVRRGKQTPEDLALLRSRIGAPLACEERGIVPTRLYAKNRDVANVNERQLAALEGETLLFRPRYGVYEKAAAGGAGKRAKPASKRGGSSADGGVAAAAAAAGGAGGFGMASASAADGGFKDDATRKADRAQAKILLDLHVAEERVRGVTVNGLGDVRIKPLELKVGAQVMLSYNLDVASGLVNGARGTVVRFARTNKERKAAGEPEREVDPEVRFTTSRKADENILYPDERLPIVRFANGRVIEVPYVRYTRDQAGVEVYAWRMALQLAWATSIHKSQSLTLDAVEADIADSFDAGMVYVALSRVKSLDALRLTRDFAATAIRVDPDVLAFYEKPFHLHRAEYLARRVDFAEAEAEAADARRGASAASASAASTEPSAAARLHSAAGVGTSGRGGAPPPSKRARKAPAADTAALAADALGLELS